MHHILGWGYQEYKEKQIQVWALKKFQLSWGRREWGRDKQGSIRSVINGMIDTAQDGREKLIKRGSNLVLVRRDGQEKLPEVVPKLCC